MKGFLQNILWCARLLLLFYEQLLCVPQFTFLPHYYCQQGVIEEQGLLLIERGDRLSSLLQRQHLQSDLCVLYVYMVHLTHTSLHHPMKIWTREKPNLWDVL